VHQRIVVLVSGNFINEVGGPLQHLGGGGFLLIAQIRDFRRRRDEAPEPALFPDDVRIVSDVSKRGHGFGEEGKIGDFIDSQLPAPVRAHPLGHRDHVHRLIVSGQMRHGAPNTPMYGGVKILFPELFHCFQHAAFRKEHGAQHGLLGLLAAGGHPLDDVGHIYLRIIGRRP